MARVWTPPEHPAHDTVTDRFRHGIEVRYYSSPQRDNTPWRLEDQVQRLGNFTWRHLATDAAKRLEQQRDRELSDE